MSPEKQRWVVKMLTLLKSVFLIKDWVEEMRRDIEKLGETQAETAQQLHDLRVEVAELKGKLNILLDAAKMRPDTPQNTSPPLLPPSE